MPQGYINLYIAFLHAFRLVSPDGESATGSCDISMFHLSQEQNSAEHTTNRMWFKLEFSFSMLTRGTLECWRGHKPNPYR